MEIQLDEAATPFSLEHTLSCGQVFRWERMGDWWYGIVGEKVVKVRQIGGRLLFQGFPEKIDAHFMENYFRLDDNLPLILSRINKDRQIGEAIRAFRGLRIIRQEPWECLISYMCATNANIPAIRNMIFNLSKKFGRKITLGNYDFYTFPKAKDLAEADLKEIEKCKLGFRVERVLEVSRMIDDKEFDLESLSKMGYKEAKDKLMSLPGVGQKVADCVLLFSLGKLEAFPVDVWIKRIILKSYPTHFEPSFTERILAKRSITPKEYEKITFFGRNYFGEYAGYAQEYLFHSRGRQQ
jgi:N-glycosylase/DNA lyase